MEFGIEMWIRSVESLFVVVNQDQKFFWWKFSALHYSHLWIRVMGSDRTNKVVGKGVKG